MPNHSQNARHGTPRRCAVCDGPFGLIRYYSWRTPLCSKKCVERLKARRDESRQWLRRLQTAWSGSGFSHVDVCTIWLRKQQVRVEPDQGNNGLNSARRALKPDDLSLFCQI
jgi:hypothetical protein